MKEKVDGPILGHDEIDAVKKSRYGDPGIHLPDVPPDADSPAWRDVN